MVYAGVLEIERTVQPFTIFHAQTRAGFANVLTPLPDAFARPVFLGPLAFLSALLLLSGPLALGVALRVLIYPRSFLLGGTPLLGRAVIALALGCPLVFLDLPLRFAMTILLVLTSGTLRAGSGLGLIPARATRLATRTARVHARASRRTVHAGLGASTWVAAMFMALSYSCAASGNQRQPGCGWNEKASHGLLSRLV